MKSRQFFLVAAAAIILRLAVMPISAHGDLLYIWSIPTLLVEGVIDPYRWAVEHHRSIAESDWDVYYPPAAYLFNGIWLAILRLFSDSLIGWLTQVRESIFSFDLLRFNLASARLNLFILKIPYLVYEIILVLGLLRLLKSVNWLKFAILWGLNPVVIYSAYMMGQIDLLTVTLVVWAGVMMYEKKKLASLTLLVVGTMVKVLPIVLIAPMAFLMGKSWKERAWLIIYSILIFVIFNLPFSHDLRRLKIAYFPPIMPGLADLSFRPDALVMIGKLITAAGVGLWLGWKIIKNEKKLEPKNSLEIIGLVLLLFFSAYRGALLNHFTVLVPFLILFWARERRAILKMAGFCGLLFLTYIYTRPLQGQLFMPLGIDWLTNLTSTRELAAPWFKYEHLSLITGAILSGWMLTEAAIKGNKILNQAT